MRALVLAVVMLTGCSTAGRVALVASTAALACDWAQTRGHAELGWGGYREMNPMLGSTPTTATVDGYFAVSAGLNALIWLAMPRRFKAIVPAMVTAVQVDTIRGNIRGGTHLCGL